MNSKKTTQSSIKEQQNRLNSYVKGHIQRLEEFFPGISERDFKRDLPKRTQTHVSKTRE